MRRAYHVAEKPQHGRLRRIRQIGHGTDIAACGSHVLGEVVRADREEFGIELVGGNRRRRNLDHDPEARASGGNPRCNQCRHLGFENASCSRQLARLRHHRQHDLDVAVRRGAGQRAQLRAKDIGLLQRKTESAHAEERVALPRVREALNRLVTTRVERSNRHRPTLRPFGNSPVDRILLLLVGQPLPVVEQELGSDEPDAVA